MFAITSLRFNKVVLGPSDQLRGASDLEFPIEMSAMRGSRKTEGGTLFSEASSGKRGRCR